MDKKVVLAVAGSGKTKLIIDRLNETKRSLIVTYTKNNLANLRQRIIIKFGYIPENIKLYTYQRFLYQFCFKPLLSDSVKAKGLNLTSIPPRYSKRSDPKSYLDSQRKLYINRLAKLIEIQNEIPSVIWRLEKYFDQLFVDEVQDFSGHDFNFLIAVSKAKIYMRFVGDFYQHTFDTSRDGAVNKNLHQNYDSYENRFIQGGIEVDKQSLNRSHRCSPSVCAFIQNSLGVEILSHRSDPTTVAFIETESEILEKYQCQDTVKLFLQKHYTYDCFSQNWGASKGEDKYNDVCIIISRKRFNLLKGEGVIQLPPSTRNKLYVACSRSKNNLYFIAQDQLPLKKYRSD